MAISNQTAASTLLAAAAALAGATSTPLTNATPASLGQYYRTTTAAASAIVVAASLASNSDPCKQTNDGHVNNELNNNNNNYNYSNNYFHDDNDSNDSNYNSRNYDDEQLYVNLSTFWYCFLAFITTVGLLVSLVSNMIIIYLFTGSPSLRRNPSNIIAVNLSLSDLLYCIQWPSVIYCSLSQSTWVLEIDLVCNTFGFITVTTASASVLTVLAMSVERAIVIKYSIHAKSRYTIRCAWFIVVLIWIVSIGSSLPPLFGKFNRFTLDPSKTSCTLDYLSPKANFKIYMLLIYIVYWILPGTIITICYIFIIVTFKRSSRNLKQVVRASSPTSRTPTSERSLSGLSGQTAPLAATDDGLGGGGGGGGGGNGCGQGPSSGGSRRGLARSLMLASWSFRSRDNRGRRHLRDSIRMSNFLGHLRRASTGRLSTRQVGVEPISGSSSASQPATLHHKTHLPPTGSRQPLPAARRILKRVATVQPLQRVAPPMSAPRTNSDQTLERAGVGPQTGRRPICMTSRALTVDESNKPGDRFYQHSRYRRRQRQQQAAVDERETEGAPNWSSSAPVAEPICDANEPELEQPPPTSAAAAAAAARHTRVPAASVGKPRSLALGAAMATTTESSGAATAAVSSAPATGDGGGGRDKDFDDDHDYEDDYADGLPPAPRPLDERHRALIGGSRTTISSEPTPSSAAKRAHLRQGRWPSRLAFVSKFVPRLDHSNGGPSRRIFSTSWQPPSRHYHHRQQFRPKASRTSTTTTAAAAAACSKVSSVEATCHFGNSHSQLSRAGMQIRLAKMSFYLILLWLVSWTPIASLTLINLIVKCHLRANALVVFLANTMTKLGPTFDVFIYGISHPRIKRKFIQIIKRLLCLKSDDAHETAAAAAAAASVNNKSANFHQRSIQRMMALSECKPPTTRVARVETDGRD